MSKQTAVEWLVNVVQSCISPNYIPKEIVKQAIEMEKEQMKDSFIVALNIVGYTILSTSTINESFEDYYNEIYK